MTIKYKKTWLFWAIEGSNVNYTRFVLNETNITIPSMVLCIYVVDVNFNACYSEINPYFLISHFSLLKC